MRRQVLHLGTAPEPLKNPRGDRSKALLGTSCIKKTRPGE